MPRFLFCTDGAPDGRLLELHGRKLSREHEGTHLASVASLQAKAETADGEFVSSSCCSC